MQSSFAKELHNATRGIPQAELARAIAELTDREPRSLAASLSRITSGKQNPRTKTIEQIVAAIANLKKLPSAQADELKATLLSAAKKPTDLRTVARLEFSEEKERGCLRPRCEAALRRRGRKLTEQQIQAVLQYAGSTTMKLIIQADEDGEDIEIMPLPDLPGDRSTSVTQTGPALPRDRAQEEETVIDAGRAKIVVEGGISQEQRELLEGAATMIRSALRLQT